MLKKKATSKNLSSEILIQQQELESSKNATEMAASMESL